MAGAGIRASAGGMIVVERQQVVEEGFPCLRADGEGNSSMEVGGRRGCKCYRGGVEGQQQQQGWWRRGIRDWGGYGGARPGGGSSNSMKAGGSGEAGG